MPVIVFIGNESEFLEHTAKYFEKKYTVVVMNDAFVRIRSSLAVQDEQTLYLLAGLSKPERYEIYCLCRKNEQLFLSVCTANQDESETSDKNVFRMQEFSGEAIEKQLQQSKITQTAANKRSKGTSLKSINELKSIMKEANSKYLLLGDVSLVLQECESRLLRMWKVVANGTTGEAEEAYKKIVEDELKRKGFMRAQTEANKKE